MIEQAAPAPSDHVREGVGLASQRQWAVKHVGGGLMIAAALLVSGVTLVADLRHEAFPPMTRTTDYVLAGSFLGFGLLLLFVSRRLPSWAANTVPSVAAALSCVPTTADEAPVELGPLLLTWPVTFSAAVLSARVAWFTLGTSGLVLGVLAASTRGVDGAVMWVETLAFLAVICWMVVRVQAQASRLRRRLTELALTDELTGLLNRRGFDEALTREHARQLRSGRPVALLLVDIDHFKRVNDTWGHPAGDATLHRLGGLLTAMFRPADVVGRFGGEEFGVVIGDSLPEQALERARGICETVRNVSVGWEHPITVSVGVAAYPGQAPAPAEMIAAADRALYAAKATGRDRVESNRVEGDGPPVASLSS
jgi:diguanylate cyclase (GGDEF)-like protein